MSDSPPNYPTIEDVIGATPMVRLVRLPGADNAQRNNVPLLTTASSALAAALKSEIAANTVARLNERVE